MEYKKFDKTIIVRLDRGDEILESVKNIALNENIKLAKIEAIGAASDFTVGVYSVSEKKYYKKDYSGDFEIVSLMGNISTMNNEFYCHLHIGASDKDGNFVGGHLNKAVIGGTCEMFITLIDGVVDRKVDDATSLNVFKF